MTENVVWLNDVSMSDIKKVGGKNASLGEMISGLSSQEIGRAHVWTPVTSLSRMPSSAWKKKKNKKI